MAMEESRRGNGWYNEGIAEPAIKDPEMAKQEYPEKIKDRVNYFSKNLGYTFNFYTMKIASMWAENTYSSIYYNTVSDIKVENMEKGLIFYQKASLILICACSLIALIKNRKSLSLDAIFLLTIFLGGFAFHILWEAKSRYIISYILILMPIASIKLNKNRVVRFPLRQNNPFPALGWRALPFKAVAFGHMSGLAQYDIPTGSRSRVKPKGVTRSGVPSSGPPPDARDAGRLPAPAPRPVQWESPGGRQWPDRSVRPPSGRAGQRCCPRWSGTRPGSMISSA